MKTKGKIVGILWIAVCLVFWIGTVHGTPISEEPEDFVLKIYKTSDVHGALLPYDFIKDQETGTSLAQVYSLVKEARDVEGQEVLLLDNGDILQGQPIVYYSNFEAVDDTHITAEVMNYMGYDAGSVGNHDIEAGHDVYDKLINEYDFPWLAANVVHAETGTPYFEPYAVFEKNGAKIVVFGLCTPGVPTWLPENLWSGMEFRGMVETAEEWVPVIMEKENPDLLIGLFHAGTDYTYSGYTEDDRLNPNGSLLVAQRVPGFDLIFTGHDHQTHNDVVVNLAGEEVLVVGGNNAARSVGSATVFMDYDPVSGLWDTDLTGEVIDGTALPVDPEFVRVFSDTKEEVKAYVNKPIGTFTKTITTRDSMFGDSAFVDLIHQVQLEITDADVSFAAPLSLDAEISEGEVYVRDMFLLYKYENLLYTMELTGAQIDDFLEYSYQYWMDTMAGPEDQLIHFKRDDQGNLVFNERYNSYDTATRYYNYDSAAGIEYIVDVSRPEGNKVEITGFTDGRRFSEGQVYEVAINSYRASGGGGHLTRGAGLEKSQLEAITLGSTDKDLRYYLMKWIESEGIVTAEADGNWAVVPDDWATAGRATSFPLLYGE